MELDWLSLDEDEEVVWSGSPRLQRLVGFVITDYVITNQGLYRKKGLLSRDVQKIGFDKVQNTSFSQGFLGRSFGYGNVEISTAGGSGIEMRFAGVDEPEKVQREINNRIKDDFGQGRAEEENVQQEMLEELRRIRSELERLNQG